MNKPLIACLLMLVLGFACAHAAEQGPAPLNSSSSRIFLNGENIAAEISRATGCAISPILGISVLGAYTYYTTPVEQRGSVPWYARPAFWAPLLAVLLGILLKDSSKIALPKILIMPLDAIETLLEKNASAALGLLVILSSITGRGIEQLQLAGHGWNFSFTASAIAAEHNAAAASSGVLELSILSILVTLVFGLVWVVSQSFNFLMFLCPFSWLDLLLAMLKNAIIALLMGAYLLNPFAGLFVSCLIILACLFLFARSYRFVIFGTIASADILFGRARQHQVESDHIKAFAGQALSGVPTLSYGSLSANGTVLTFAYRPWLLLPLKTVPISHSTQSCEMGIGNLSPVICCKGRHFHTPVTLFRLRPLYRGRETRVAELLGLAGVRDMTIGKTLQDGLRWLKEQLGKGSHSARTVS